MQPAYLLIYICSVKSVCLVLFIVKLTEKGKQASDFRVQASTSTPSPQ
jgi:hypothetical protein